MPFGKRRGNDSTGRDTKEMDRMMVLLKDAFLQIHQPMTDGQLENSQPVVIQQLQEKLAEAKSEIQALNKKAEDDLLKTMESDAKRQKAMESDATERRERDDTERRERDEKWFNFFQSQTQQQTSMMNAQSQEREREMESDATERRERDDTERREREEKWFNFFQSQSQQQTSMMNAQSQQQTTMMNAMGVFANRVMGGAASNFYPQNFQQYAQDGQPNGQFGQYPQWQPNGQYGQYPQWNPQHCLMNNSASLPQNQQVGSWQFDTNLMRGQSQWPTRTDFAGPPESTNQLHQYGTNQFPATHAHAPGESPIPNAHTGQSNDTQTRQSPPASQV